MIRSTSRRRMRKNTVPPQAGQRMPPFWAAAGAALAGPEDDGGVSMGFLTLGNIGGTALRAIRARSPGPEAEAKATGAARAGSSVLIVPGQIVGSWSPTRYRETPDAGRFTALCLSRADSSNPAGREECLSGGIALWTKGLRAA